MVIGLGQVVERGLGLLLDVSRNVELLTRKVDELADSQLQADERQRRLDERTDKLAESLQRYLDSQSRRNGGE